MQVDTSAADIDQLTRLEVGQQPRVLRDGPGLLRLRQDDITDGK
jgi:hypothetical protein